MLTARFQESSSRAEKSAPRMPPKPPQDDSSVTEEEPDDDDFVPLGGKGKEPIADHRRADAGPSSPARSVPSKRATPDHAAPPVSRNSPNRPSRDSSSPLPPPKKSKRMPAAGSSGDDSSSEEQKTRAAGAKGGARRGVKQPIKRGGKRF